MSKERLRAAIEPADIAGGPVGHAFFCGRYFLGSCRNVLTLLAITRSQGRQRQARPTDDLPWSAQIRDITS